jgi:hypothetical protein
MPTRHGPRFAGRIRRALANVATAGGCVLASGGCYSYVPVPAIRPPAQGTPVRVALEAPSEFRLTDLTANDIVRVGGEMIQANDGSLAISALWLESRAGMQFTGKGETVRIPETNIIFFQEKRFSPTKSALFAAATVGGFLLLREAFLAVGGGGNGRKGGPPTTN